MDICLCASSECPKYSECLRAEENRKERIYTASYLREVCNQNNKYAEFIPKEYEK